jgi:hypothetical protein
MIKQEVEERRLQLLHKYNNPKFVILLYPTSMMHKIWDLLNIVLLLYTATYAPYRTAFMTYNSSGLLIFFETVTDIIMFLDVIVSFLTPYERFDGSLECNVRKIAIHYSTSALAIDLLSCFPTQFFELGVASTVIQGSIRVQ